MKVIVENTKTGEKKAYRTIADCVAKHTKESAKTGYTFKVWNEDETALIGNIRPNPNPYKTKNNPCGKLTARFIRHD